MEEYISEIVVAIISFFAGVCCTIIVQKYIRKDSNKHRDLTQKIQGNNNTQSGRDTHGR